MANWPRLLTAVRHDAVSLPGGGTRVRLSVSQSGWLESVMGNFYRGLTDRYLLHEANGLKIRCHRTPFIDGHNGSGTGFRET